MQDGFFKTSSKRSIRLIPAHTCITQTLSAKAPLSSQEILAQAYKTQLNLKQNYLFYFHFQALTSQYLCFFASKQDKRPATLDLLLPLGLRSELCCIFLSQDKNYLCFYQNHSLLFCKEFQGDLSSPLQHLSLLFDHRPQEIYALSYCEELRLSLAKQRPLKPLLSLFSPDLGFELSSIQSPLTLTSFYDLNPKPQSPSSKTPKILASLLLAGILLPALLLLALRFHQERLSRSLQALNQSTSSAFASPIQEIQRLKSQNQQYLATLLHFSLQASQKLAPLIHIAPLIHSPTFLALSFRFPETFQIRFKPSSDLTPIIASLNAKGYRCKSFTDEEGVLLELVQ